MLRRVLNRLLRGVFAVIVLTSCGSKGAGTAEFATVFATVNPAVAGLDADVATWLDATGTKITPCVAGAIPHVAPNDVVYTVTATAYAPANTGTISTIPVSNLLINKISFTLTPADTLSPALPPLFQSQQGSPGQLIVPGTNSVTVRIVSDELKSYMMNSLGAQSLDCSNQGFYHYWAVVSFQAVEVNTNKVATITAPALKVTISDFTDP